MSLKVLIVNKFYYPRGGDCICTINLERLLREHGHITAVYSMDYPENIPTQWSSYFAPQVDFSSGGIRARLAAVKRIMGLGDINKSFNRILDNFRPDVVHLNNIHSYLSPRLAQLAKRRGIKVVWTLHDYKLICPAYLCLRDGKPCEDCFTSKSGVLKYRCMKGSAAASALAYIEALKWNRKVLENNVDVFICPSGFMRSKMLKAGFSDNKLAVNCNFLDFDKANLINGESEKPREPYYCYVGRLSEEKGINLLLRVAETLPFKLKLAGDGPLMQKAKSDHIEFLGKLNAVQVCDLLSKATFSVAPSTCYDNNPLSVIESVSLGTPVVGADIGGIPELIEVGKTGFLFEAGNADELTKAINDAFNIKWNYNQIEEDSIKRFLADTHYNKLIEIYQS